MNKKESEALTAIKVVITEIQKMFSHLNLNMADLSAAAERNPEAWECVKSDIPEMGPYLKRVLDAYYTLLADYEAGNHSKADMRRLAVTVHDSAKTLAETAIKIHKFISKEEVGDNIAYDLRDAALKLEDANRALALHM